MKSSDPTPSSPHSQDSNGENPSAADISLEIESEFKRMSEDADALLHAILNDEHDDDNDEDKSGKKNKTSSSSSSSSSNLKTPPSKGSSGSSGNGSGVGGSGSGSGALGRGAGSLYEDDDMSDELIHLDRETNDLQRELSAISEMDQDRVKELIHGAGIDDDEINGDSLVIASGRERDENKSNENNENNSHQSSYSLHSPSRAVKMTGSCGASAAPLPAGFSIENDMSLPLLCQEAVKNISNSNNSNHKNKNNQVLFPYDPAVAELRALMKAVVENSKKTQQEPAVVSRTRVIKPEPSPKLDWLTMFLEFPSGSGGVNWVLVATFVIVWGTVVVLMDHARHDLLDEEGHVQLLPAMLR